MVVVTRAIVAPGLFRTSEIAFPTAADTIAVYKMGWLIAVEWKDFARPVVISRTSTDTGIILADLPMTPLIAKLRSCVDAPATGPGPNILCEKLRSGWMS